MAPHITLTSITSYEVWFQLDQTPSQGLAPGNPGNLASFPVPIFRMGPGNDATGNP